MRYLVDTNAVSEWTKPKPDVGFVAWLRETDENAVFLSVITLAELRLGIERLAQGVRRFRLESWVQDDVMNRFEGRILALDFLIADAWGRLTAEGESRGRAISAMDAFLAATARVHSMTLVTRNMKDFVGFCEVINPWSQ
jgi:toxin FitB